MSNIAGQSGSQYFDTAVFNALVPKEGPKAMAINCPFASATEFSIDLTLSQTQKYLSLVQGVYIDNSLNADAVTLVCGGGTSQKIVFPPNAQGYLPLLVSRPTTFTVSSAGGVNVPIIFLNVPVPAIIWGQSAGGGGGGGLAEMTGTVFVIPNVIDGKQVPLSSDGAGNLRVALAASTDGTYANSSMQALKTNGANELLVNLNYATVYVEPASAGSTFNVGQVSVSNTAATQIVAQNNSNGGCRIKNPGPNSVYIGPDNTVTLATGFELGAGDSFDFTAPIAMNFAVWGIAATTAQTVSFLGLNE